MQRTRRIILDLLKRHGKATLDQLASEVGVVPMTIRAHLSILERDGLVCYEEERGRVGRPRFVYSLTQEAQDQFPKTYDSLCNRILDAVTSVHCPVSDRQIVDLLAEAWAKERSDRVAGKDLEERVKTVVAIRTEEGAMASFSTTADGYLIDQHHCPASCVARRHPGIVCAAEMSYLERLLGVPIERVTWRVDGGDSCSYLVHRPVEPADPQAT